MKNVFLFIGLSLFFFKSNAQNQNAGDDWGLIHKTLDLYIDGQTIDNSVKIDLIFYSSWQLKGFGYKEFVIVPRSKYIVGCKKHDVKPDNWLDHSFY